MRVLRAVVVAVAVVLLLALVVDVVRPLDAAAPPMTAASARAWLQSASEDFASGNLTRTLDMVAPNADVLCYPPEKVRLALQGLARDRGSRNLRLQWSAPTVSSSGSHASISVTLDVTEHTARSDARYLRIPLSLDLAKYPVSGLGGLRTVELWKVTRATSPVQINMSYWLP